MWPTFGVLEVGPGGINGTMKKSPKKNLKYSKDHTFREGEDRCVHSVLLLLKQKKAVFLTEGITRHALTGFKKNEGSKTHTGTNGAITTGGEGRGEGRLIYDKSRKREGGTTASLP